MLSGHEDKFVVESMLCCSLERHLEEVNCAAVLFGVLYHFPLLVFNSAGASDDMGLLL